MNSKNQQYPKSAKVHSFIDNFLFLILPPMYKLYTTHTKKEERKKEKERGRASQSGIGAFVRSLALGWSIISPDEKSSLKL